MTTGIEAYSVDGTLLLSSQLKPQGFHYRFSHDASRLDLGDSYTQTGYTTLRPGTSGSPPKLRRREVFGGLSDAAIASYPQFRPDVKSDGDGDGHNHHVVYDGGMAWVCVPSGIFMSASRKDGYGYTVGTQTNVYPTASMIVTGSQKNLPEGYLTQYSPVDGSVIWTISEYFRHPNVQYIWQKPRGSTTDEDIRNNRNREASYYVYNTYPKYDAFVTNYRQVYKSKDGHPLYVCMTMGVAMNGCGPAYAWNADGTELTVQYEGEASYAHAYSTVTHVVLNVPIASFPSVKLDYY